MNQKIIALKIMYGVGIVALTGGILLSARARDYAGALVCAGIMLNMVHMLLIVSTPLGDPSRRRAGKPEPAWTWLLVLASSLSITAALIIYALSH